ncbi:CIC11C00000003027 [Sungouiella intermedia]|uniref:Protein BIG1 n=1 Tax=Sungouiella intermedia TaxID=45354 RepID=A0A1L0BB14_9ASCO|nr:CIC11C00000003027 [[Candida] intermedia]
MKVLASLALCVGSVMAFADTAPMYSGLNAFSSDYIVEATEVASQVGEYTSNLCSQDDRQKLYIYRVSGLQATKPQSDAINYVRHVHYDRAVDLDFPISKECVVKYASSLDSEVGDADVVVVDIDDGIAHKFEEFSTNGAFIVQGKPLFTVKKRSFRETIQEDLDILKKRYYESEELDDEDSEATFSEVEADFKAAESMIAEEESFVTAFAEEKEGLVPGASKGNSTGKAKSNLFTEYRFFTPGVWLSLIVSLFLVFVVSTAVGWITSIETSYNAFEKQVDYEKKNE